MIEWNKKNLIRQIFRYPEEAGVRSSTPEDGEIDSGDETAPPAAGALRMDAESGARAGSMEAIGGSGKSTPDFEKVAADRKAERPPPAAKFDAEMGGQGQSADEFASHCLPVDVGNGQR